MTSIDASLLTVQPGSFLTLHYRLAGPAGDVINTFADKPATLSLGAGEFEHSHQLGALGRAQALDAFEVGSAGVQQTSYATKATTELTCGVHRRRVEQLLRHLQHALAHDAGAQQDGQQLGIGQCRRAACQQFFAGLGIGGQVFEGHGAGCLTPVRGRRA